ncbi:type I-E CRISPR-associated endonuclease Cas1e [Streptomyces albidus (ex Kaewkla and Franco 2022)]|uniref:type I-E CRISPR-associated endonuclease Cas1e n=1 Tax=Streptomyces albidus (ex Kaewkla and Franco 2022) TaxID=722709 RepID=UPI003AF32D36
MLPRIGDSLSFLYLDIARVVQDDTGVDAVIETTHGEQRIPLPTAALSCLLLGPGASITTRALTTFPRHRTTVICTGAAGVRCYSATVADSLPTRWLEVQARVWADPEQRTEVARRMYRTRFGDTAPPDATIAQLRGLEGQRMKALYRMLATQHGVRPFKRSYDPDDWDTQDPVNQALSAANTCLYGIVHAAVNALGCTPGLGFVHTGTSHSFVYDLPTFTRPVSRFLSPSHCTVLMTPRAMLVDPSVRNSGCSASCRALSPISRTPWNLAQAHPMRTWKKPLRSWSIFGTRTPAR